MLSLIRWSWPPSLGKVVLNLRCLTQTLVSTGGVFQLGFFSPPAGVGARGGAIRTTYLGIWYHGIPGTPTVVWVGNRRSPLLGSSPGVLRLSADGRLVILDGNNGTVVVWSSPAPSRNNVTDGATARLLDNGNLVLSVDGSGSDGSVAWQSFDSPTDTLLPGMKLGVDVSAGISRTITSWRSPVDPSPGGYEFKLVRGGLPEFFLVRGTETKLYGSGPWNSDMLTGVPYLKSNADFISFKVVSGPNETFYTYTIIANSTTLLSRFVVDGGLQQILRLVWIDGAWRTFSSYPSEPCDTYAMCGAFGYCDAYAMCRCLPGFLPRNPRQWNLRFWSGGCIRRSRTTCDGNDGFVVVKQMKLPDATNATLYSRMTAEQCRQVCLGNCTCRAYIITANISGRGSRGCVIWTTDLVDMRQFTTVVHELYVRLPQSEVDALDSAAAGPTSNSSDNALLPPASASSPRKKSTLKYIFVGVSALIGSISIAILVCLLCYKRYNGIMPWKTRSVRAPQQGLESFMQKHGTVYPRRYSFSEVKNMTKLFAEKLGEGGYGAVYKGTLLDGRAIAVKAIKDINGDGEDFTNEVASISKTAHINVVSLLGFCIEGSDRALIYEFMPNGSLNGYTFGSNPSEVDKMLSWKTLFDIIIGIARGLDYLDRGCKTKIVHFDIKPHNILLDQDFCPKISDFGLAKLCEQKVSHVSIYEARGTMGYVAPEVISPFYGNVSSKSDVYSFGMLILELVGAKKQNEVRTDSTTKYFADWLYENVDQFCSITCGLTYNNVGIVKKMVIIGLWCIEKRSMDRPSICKVLEMLESDQSELQLPPKRTLPPDGTFEGSCSTDPSDDEDDPTDDEDDDFHKDIELEWNKIKRKYKVDSSLGESSYQPARRRKQMPEVKHERNEESEEVLEEPAESKRSFIQPPPAQGSSSSRPTLLRSPMAASVPNVNPTVSSLVTTVPVQAVLFDIEGTLYDSDPLHHVAFQEMLIEIGYNNGVRIDKEFFIKNIAGRSDVEAAQNLFPDWPLEKALKFLDDKEAKYRSLAKERLEPVKGLGKVVQWVKDHGYKRAAVTNAAPRMNAELMISLLGLSDFFQSTIIVIGGECDQPKPSPYDPYLKALKELQVSAEHTLIFENSPSGIRTGVVAGAALLIKDYEDPKLWAALEEIDREEAKLKKASTT